MFVIQPKKLNCRKRDNIYIFLEIVMLYDKNDKTDIQPVNVGHISCSDGAHKLIKLTGVNNVQALALALSLGDTLRC